MPRHLWKLLALAAMLCLISCGDADTTEQTNTDQDQDSSLTGPCTLASDLPDCGACFSGMVTCSYGEISVTESSCQNCQALNVLYTALCDGGVTDTVADIEAGTECLDPVQ
jgi:hypothetical protein